MSKPQTVDGYNSTVTEACERVLVTLLRGIVPLKESVFLIGGLTPRYLIRARPPKVPHHAGTGDVDVVVHLSILAALRILAARFCDDDHAEGHRKDGPVAVARFEEDGNEDEGRRDRRILRQRRASDLIASLALPLLGR